MEKVIAPFHVVWRLTLFNLKARYRGTWGGMLWVIINPLAMYGVQSLVFKKFLRLDIPNYFTFLMAGLLPWIFITMTLRMAPPLFEHNHSLIKSFRMNPLILVRGQLIDNFINFLIPFCLLVLALQVFEGALDLVAFIQIPLAMIPLLLASYGLSLILAVSQVIYRDTRFVLDFVLSFLYFLTPIFYPRSYVPEDFQFLMDFNIFYQWIAPFQLALKSQGEGVEFAQQMAISLVLAVVVNLLGHWAWKSKRNAIYMRL